MDAGDDNLLKPKGPRAKKAQELGDEIWARARAHELTEEDLQATLARLGELADQEPNEDERSWIRAEILHLDDVFDAVEGEEATAPLRESKLVAQAREIFARAPLNAPSEEPVEERQARLREVDDALTEISQVYDQADSREQHYIQDYIDLLWAVLDPGRGAV